MKFSKLLPLATVAGVFAASSAFADVTIRITGSTAYRASTVASIKNVMSGGSPLHAWQSSSSFTGANYHIFQGTVPGISGTVTVKCSWNGAVAGGKAVATGQSLTFLSDTTPMSTTPTTAANGANVNSSNLVASEGVAFLTMTDNYQLSTKYTSPTLTDDIVGVVPFKWVASFGAPASFTNMTPQIAKALLAAGYTSGALISGNAADGYDQPTGYYVYAAGRDPLSGTRLSTLAETTYGVFTPVVQFRPKASSIVSNVVGEIEITPVDVPNDALFPGDGGETSGGNLADKMRYTTTAVNENDILGLVGAKVVFITYLGISDATRAITGTGSNVTGTNSGNAKELTWNGVPYSQANVENGYYSFWSYEHLMMKTQAGQVGTDHTTFKNALKTNIIANPGASGISTASMKVQRSNDGGPIVPIY